MAEPTGGRGRIVLGTMRLHEAQRSVGEWVEFFVAAHRLGVTTLHSSSEYESFPLFCEILSRLARDAPDVRFRHMVKLGEPHFDEADFEPKRLSERIDCYRDALRVDCIADVQWMWRGGLDNDPVRISRFLARQSPIADGVDALKVGGRIGRFLCFPYTPPFAQAALDVAAVDGLVVYRNVQEREYDDAIDGAAARAKPSVVIRPFNAGKAFDGRGPGPLALLRLALDKPGIESAILSTSSIDHVEQLIERES